MDREMAIGKIVELLEAMNHNTKEIVVWMSSPFPMGNGKTPLDLITDGRGQEVIDQLICLAQGNIGS